MWHFNGVKLLQSTEKQQILANGTLVIREATLSNAGHYKCTVTGATAGQIQAEANVRVIGTYHCVFCMAEVSQECDSMEFNIGDVGAE